MRQGSPVPAPGLTGGIEERLWREGWSLHQRLQGAPRVAGRSDALAGWRTLVSPENHANFVKRQRWDELSELSAAWALDPPPEATPKDPYWWSLLDGLRQADHSGDNHAGLQTIEAADR